MDGKTYCKAKAITNNGFYRSRYFIANDMILE